MKKLVTFGEIMLRLQPPGNMLISQTHGYDAVYGGGEANVAVSAANYGMPAAFVTKLPENAVADACIAELRGIGVDTSHIVRGGGRMGIYFVEGGASQRPSRVTYDRAHSAIAEAAVRDFDWEKIFDGADWFHFTGITPALSDSCAEICLCACRAAKRLGLTVSCDLNYRKKLWSPERANAVMSALMEYTDICIANEEDADKVFGIRADDADITAGRVGAEGYRTVCRRLTERFGFSRVAVTLRESVSASMNNWSAILYADGEFYVSRRYSVTIVDRIGAGDSFAGGLIYAMTTDSQPQRQLEFAVAASCLKHTIPGDYNRVSVSDVEALASGDGSGRVSR